jgi:nucleoside-diphosphate-sugar epimerase
MMRLLIIGYGGVAARAVPCLVSRYRLFALTRNREKAARLSSAGITPILGDLDKPTTLVRLAGLADLVFHAAPPQNEGSEDRRTKHLLAALGGGESLPQRLIYISTTGVYGDRGGALVHESSRLRAQTARAARRVDAERRLRCWGARNAVGIAILRVPGIYGPNRLPLARLRAATPALAASEDVFTNHIHVDDLARACIAALRLGKPNRAYNVCDDSQLKMGDYFDLVADSFDLPRPPRVAREEAARVLPATLLSFMAESRRIDNRRLKSELRVALRYPTVQEGVAAIAVRTPE